MDEEYTISYAKMKKMVKNYYKEQGRDVELRITNEIDNDRHIGDLTTTICLIEKRKIAGVEARKIDYLSEDDLKDIINLILESEGIEIADLTDDAFVSSRIEGFGMDEHIVPYVTSKTFTLIIKEKKQSHQK